MAGRGLARQQATFTPTVVAQLATLEEDLGGRGELVGMLALAPLTKDLQFVLGMLGDPQHQRLSLAEICARGNILPGQLLGLLEGAALQKGKVQAARIVAKGLPAVVQNVMDRAAPYEGACGDCQGVGTITPDPTPTQPNPSPASCETCNGLGKLIYQPNLRHQELALEMGRMLPKGGGLVIQQNNLNQAQGGGGSLGGGTLERLTQLTDQILYGDEDAIEGEISDPAEPEGDVSP